MSDLLRQLAARLASFDAMKAEAARNATASLKATGAVEYSPSMWKRRGPEDEGYFSLAESGLPGGSLYHVAPVTAIKAIAADGALRPAFQVGKKPNFVSDQPVPDYAIDYGKHSEGRSFLTDQDGLGFWLGKLGRRQHGSRLGIMSFDDPRLVPIRRDWSHDQNINLYGSPFPVVVESHKELGPVVSLGTAPESQSAYQAAHQEYDSNLRSLGIEQDRRLGIASPAVLQPPVKPGSPVLHYDQHGTPHAEAYAYFINSLPGTKVDVPPELARKIAAMSLGAALLQRDGSKAESKSFPPSHAY